jgi:hypothetical protein
MLMNTGLRGGKQMKCFYQGRQRESEGISSDNSFVSFTIPDIGITFRAQFSGTKDECDYASLLALLEFVELNPHLFKNKRIEIFGDNFKVVSQVNQKIRPSKDLEPYLDMAVGYKRKIPFVLKWIPDSENPAQDGMTA